MPANRIRPHNAQPGTNGDAYQASLRLLFGAKPTSLRIRCPRCGRHGLVITKWVKGRTVKPVYVLHGGNGHPVKECRLRKGNEESIRTEVDLSAQDLKKLLADAKTYVLFSGGGDSLCTLLYLREICGNNGHHLTALHVDTTAGFPEVTAYVRRICKRLGVPLQIVRPEREYFDLAKKWGIPGFKARWCCKELKVKPVRDFLAGVDGAKVVVDGIRAAESFQRSTYMPVWFHPTFRCFSVSPIIRWSDEDVRTYLKKTGLPQGPAKKLGCSAECWCGAYKKRPDFEKLLEIHPDIFDKLIEVERAQRGRYTFLYEDGERVPLETLKHSKKGSARLQ